MRLRFWGVRGSIPTPGESTVRYGGNTPCTEIRLGNDELIILDAGTGIRKLGDQLMARGQSVHATVLITHPHWDHIQGFPFFKPAFVSGNTLVIVGTERPEKKLSEIVSDQMNRIYFPVQLNELKATLTFRPVKDEQNLDVYGAKVRTMYVNHPGFTVAYRIEFNGKTLVYISDNEPYDRGAAASLENFEDLVKDKFEETNGDPNQRVFEFCRDADLLIHDATYTPEEYVDRVGWGHSHYLFALRVAAEAGVRKLCLFHHDPNHSDNDVDKIVKACRNEIKRMGYSFECFAAEENLELEL